MCMITNAKSVPNCFFLTLMCKIIEMYMLMREKCGGIVWVIRGKFLNLWLLNSEC